MEAETLYSSDDVYLSQCHALCPQDCVTAGLWIVLNARAIVQWYQAVHSRLSMDLDDTTQCSFPVFRSRWT